MYSNEKIQQSRILEQVIDGHATRDGAGVSLIRFLHGASLQKRLDPFLMLDVFGSEDPGKYIAGFPDHPHRGFETITYMLEGCMLHRDSFGNEGLLNNGDLQWMCAGSGVIHSEMPQQIAGRMEGFQLWLNLPAHLKMSEPWYKDIRSATVPVVTLDSGARVRVVAGNSHGVAGIMQRPVTEPIYLDVEVPAGVSLSHQLPIGHNAFIQLYRGSIRVAGQQMKGATMGILSNAADADGVTVQADSDARYLLIAGKPLNEPIEQYGPFVMNTKDEIHQAIQDFRGGRMG